MIEKQQTNEIDSLKLKRLMKILEKYENLNK
jgi:hypothetical protein